MHPETLETLEAISASVAQPYGFEPVRFSKPSRIRAAWSTSSRTRRRPRTSAKVTLAYLSFLANDEA